MMQAVINLEQAEQNTPGVRTGQRCLRPCSLGRCHLYIPSSAPPTPPLWRQTRAPAQLPWQRLRKHLMLLQPGPEGQEAAQGPPPWRPTQRRPPRPRQRAMLSSAPPQTRARPALHTAGARRPPTRWGRLPVLQAQAQAQAGWRLQLPQGQPLGRLGSGWVVAVGVTVGVGVPACHQQLPSTCWHPSAPSWPPCTPHSARDKGRGRGRAC